MPDQACTLEQVRTQLKLAPADTTDDAYITALIERCTDWMQDFVGRLLCPRASTTVLVDTAAGSIINVRRYGVRAVSALGIASTNQPDTGGSYTSVAAANIVLRPPVMSRREGMPATEIHILGASAQLSTAINGASITATWGPDSTPLRIVGVAVDAVASAYQARKAGGSGVIGADEAAATEWSRYFAAGSPQRATLQRLKLPGVG